MAFLLNVFALSLAWMFVQCNDQKDEQFIFQNSSSDKTKTVVIVSWNGDETSTRCDILTSNKFINEVLKSSDANNIRTLSENDMRNLLEECKEFNLKSMNENAAEVTRDENDIDSGTDSPKSTTPGYEGLPVIFPGTKWCGAGDRAKNYDDLGLHQDTDRCCRTHDHCDDLLAPGETKNNLTNKSPFTKLSCDCDNEFYSCLDRVNSMTSNTIGNMYFNILKRECYALDYPQKCTKHLGFFKKICLKYGKDTSKKKSYQWIPAKKYKKLPVPGPLTITLPF